ncbi:hypothetical protein K435DRAFT_876721 [Dendrothele bispora CBS 962.96]|uniref:Uncharacterized protein n=1 Tax=Dendrothele bispora (strain CBS 962.96) TaxID=1314807 RepID=A0A4S8KRG2_DENBC|nr:hypothetical protein K435DRAFT_876721 [Dendrothele bispora CBS 962.96]
MHVMIVVDEKYGVSTLAPIRCASTQGIMKATARACQTIFVAHARFKESTKRGPKPSNNRIDASQPWDVLVTKILQSTEADPVHIPNGKDAVRSILFKLASRLKTLEKELNRCRENHSGGLDDSFTRSRTAIDSSPSLGGADGESVKLVETSTADEKDSVTDLANDLAQFTIGIPKGVHFGESSNMMLLMSALNHRKELSLCCLKRSKIIFRYFNAFYTFSDLSSVTCDMSQFRYFKFRHPILQEQHINFNFSFRYFNCKN